MMKRVLCIWTIAVLLLGTAAALNIRQDGKVSKSEYQSEPIHLITSHDQSNNNVIVADLYCVVAEREQSIYIGTHYACSDYELLLEETTEEEDEAEPPPTTGIELTLNGDFCLTASMDGTAINMNTDRYDADIGFKLHAFSNRYPANPEINLIEGEVRLGVKRWIPHNSILEVRILDCHGHPSNYYTLTIYPEPATSGSTTTTGKQAAATRTSTTQTPTTTAVGSRTTKLVITAVHAATTQAEKQTTVVAAAAKAAAPKTTVRASTTAKPAKTTKAAKTTAAAVSHTARAENVPTTSETGTEPVTEQSRETASGEAFNARRFHTLNKVKLVGIALVSALTTAAVMIAVFAAVRRSPAPPAAPKSGGTDAWDDTDPQDLVAEDTPEEAPYDDF